MAEKELDTVGIERRLDVLIRLMLRPTDVQEMTNREQIALLSSAGLRDTEIANILGKTRSYVASEMTQVRKKEKNE
jgi:DNA-binding CsgD family transcriptional regulator